MSHWFLTINLADRVQQWKNGELTITGLAEAVADRIKNSGWLALTPYADTFSDHLALAPSIETQAEYLAWFDEIYDLADEDGVWIETS